MSRYKGPKWIVTELLQEEETSSYKNKSQILPCWGISYGKKNTNKQKKKKKREMPESENSTPETYLL